jgi:hypothetical protein
MPDNLKALALHYFTELDVARVVQRRAGNAHLDSHLRDLGEAEAELRRALGIPATPDSRQDGI